MKMREFLIKISFSRGLFSGDMSVSGRVHKKPYREIQAERS